MLRIAGIIVLLTASLALAAAPTRRSAKPAVVKKGPWTKKVEAGKDLWATLKTSEGDIVVQLFPKEAPETVANFVGLATGEKDWSDPMTGAPMKRKPLYNGVLFHRVIPNFMIQGGDPSATGRGGPGYEFADEFQSGRKFDKPGLLAMANAGPNTNGSQFFITVGDTAFLNGRHTIFGEVVQGYDVAVKIANVQRDRMDRPLTAVTIQTIVISDKPPKAPPVDKPAQATGKGSRSR
jgi:peptidyl-prolyl cis-trans isomerase A (cyclophilin A)